MLHRHRQCRRLRAQQLRDRDSAGHDDILVVVISEREPQAALSARQRQALGLIRSHQHRHHMHRLRLVVDLLDILGNREHFDILQNDLGHWLVAIAGRNYDVHMCVRQHEARASDRPLPVRTRRARTRA